VTKAPPEYDDYTTDEIAAVKSLVTFYLEDVANVAKYYPGYLTINL